MITEKKFSQGVIHDENINGNSPFLKIENIDGIKTIPVFSVRDRSHHQAVARAMVSGEVVAFEVGVIGLMVAINDARRGESEWKTFWEVKKGRASEDKVPFMMLPEDQDHVVDLDRVHEDFHFLKNPEARKEFFGKLPLHTILPLREDNETLDRKAFVTTSEEAMKKPPDQRLSLSTVCIFWPGGDMDWRNIAELAKKINPNVFLGITSFNEHGKPSPWNFDELATHIKNGFGKELDHIVRDPLISRADIRSSHTQIRIPLRGESSEILVVRKGPVSPETLREFTGFSVRTLESAKLASRGHPADVSLDERLLKHLQLLREK